MGSFEIGVVLVHAQAGAERTTPRWHDMREIALAAEQAGFDALWTIDELLWLPEGKAPMGSWEGVAMAGAVAAATSRIKVGSWVLSALHRNAGITAKVVETLDEISGGRFVFGLGAGHAGPGQAHAFGLPEDATFARFEDALEIIVPLLREGRADHEGRFHSARDLHQVPQGPRPGAIPIMIGGLGPRGQRLAVRYADIWSCYPDERSHIEEYLPRIVSLDAICAEVGRDPTTIGRSAGVEVKPLEQSDDGSGAITGSAEEIADAIRTFRDAGYTQLEIMLGPLTMPALEALFPVLELVRAD